MVYFKIESFSSTNCKERIKILIYDRSTDHPHNLRSPSLLLSLTTICISFICLPYLNGSFNFVTLEKRDAKTGILTEKHLKLRNSKNEPTEPTDNDQRGPRSRWLKRNE